MDNFIHKQNYTNKKETESSNYKKIRPSQQNQSNVNILNSILK